MTRLLPTLIAVAALALTAAPASASETFSNTSPITVNSVGKASPYPSTIDVQGMPGRITDVGVTLRGVNHGAGSDLDVLLVAPDGDASIVMSDACGRKIPGLNLTFTAFEAAPGLPAFGCLDSGFYRTTDYAGAGSDAWPGAPSGPHTADLDGLVGGSPNGQWKLYVHDDRAGDSGKIAGGWSLTVTTAVPLVEFPEDVAGPATPSIATRTVTGLGGVIDDVDVSLSGVYHERLKDLLVILIPPHRGEIRLMQSTCGTQRAKNATWRWDDAADAVMSADGPCPDGSYLPTREGAETGRLSDFLNGKDPNGEWKLYLADSRAEAGGFVLHDFGLHIETRPPAPVAFDQATMELREGETGELTVSRPAGSGRGSVTVTSAGVSASSGDDFDPVSTTLAFERDETTKSIPVAALADSRREGPETFELQIGAADRDAAPGAPATAVVTIDDATEPQGGPPASERPRPAAVDRERPAIAGVRLAPSRFAVARRGRARSGGRRGTRIGFTLSEPAAVGLRFQRCRGDRCRTVGSLRREGRAGRNLHAFSGRIGRKALRPGSYRLVVAAVDAAGNRSAARPRRFRVVGR